MFICDRLPLMTLTQWGRCPKGESDEGYPRWGPVPLGPTAAQSRRCHWGPVGEAEAPTLDHDEQMSEVKA